MKPLVVLEHLFLPDRGFRFITSTSDKDPTKLHDGRTAYKVIGYVDTIEEGQTLTLKFDQEKVYEGEQEFEKLCELNGEKISYPYTVDEITLKNDEDRTNFINECF